MKLIINEKQFKKLIATNLFEQKKSISELLKTSTIVQEFIDDVKKTPGMLAYLKFPSYKRLEEYLEDNGIKELNELRKEFKEFKEKKKD